MRRAAKVPEKVVQQNCINLLRSVGASVYVLGTRRRKGDHQGTMQTPGIPDVWFLMPARGVHEDGRSGWLECKADGGRMSLAQAQFMHLCADCGVDHIVGGVDELMSYLVSRKRLDPKNLR